MSCNSQKDVSNLEDMLEDKFNLDLTDVKIKSIDNVKPQLSAP